MFYEVEVKSHIRVSPELFNSDTDEAVLQQLNKQFEGFISKDFGFVIGVSSIVNVGDGVIIPGDGAAYYETTFKLFSYKPELQEVILGKVLEITDFGAFINIGAVDGMVHVSQTMDDYVTFSKSNVLTGKESKRSLKVGDKCRARLIAISFKDPANPKIGLTMRQHMLGNLKWIEDELNKKEKTTKKK
ncbi:DNA-directed RNA polymerase [Candidatus Woesearchaeota archaeon]|nr:DNA-directed RNA polymerase [Candidatus Woesearchaeota archaeon]